MRQAHRISNWSDTKGTTHLSPQSTVLMSLSTIVIRKNLPRNSKAMNYKWIETTICICLLRLVWMIWCSSSRTAHFLQLILGVFWSRIWVYWSNRCWPEALKSTIKECMSQRCKATLNITVVSRLPYSQQTTEEIAIVSKAWTAVLPHYRN